MIKITDAMLKVLVFLFVSCSAISQDDLSLSISIPKNSGFLVNYERFEIKQDTLYVIDRIFDISFKDSIKGNNYKSDTTAFYMMEKSDLQELRTILSGIDSLGDYNAHGCLFQMGWPRFFIRATIDGKEMQGYIANCYREHIFVLVDFFNTCYPKGDIIKYDRSELIALEKKCNEDDFGRGKSK